MTNCSVSLIILVEMLSTSYSVIDWVASTLVPSHKIRSSDDSPHLSTKFSVSFLRRPWNLTSPVFAIEPEDVCSMNALTPGMEWSTGSASTCMESIENLLPSSKTLIVLGIGGFVLAVALPISFLLFR